MTERSRLKVGVDVPWVTSWSDEEISVGPCPTVEGRIAVLQAENPEYGRPLYSMNHFRRQRETVLGMLCPMCGAPTSSGDRWSQTGTRVPAGVLRARGLDTAAPREVDDAQVILDVGSVGPGHLTCMRRALEHCPHLRTQADRELKPFPERWTVTPMVVQATVNHQPPAIMAIAFLQLCGVTEAFDADWRRLL